MRDRVFVDTNILLRHLLTDDPVLSPPATEFMNRVASGQYLAVLSATVLFETIYVLEKQRRIDRSTIRRDLIAIITLPSVELADTGMYAEVFRRYVERPSLSFADCFHIVLARKLTDGRLATFDEALGEAKGVDWVHPA